jgi:FtsP/CotA-like multicopper oxidase with cupredoxin domain
MRPGLRAALDFGVESLEAVGWAPSWSTPGRLGSPNGQSPNRAAGLHFQELELDFVADNPGQTLFYCHQRLHMGFGFMGVFKYP